MSKKLASNVFEKLQEENEVGFKDVSDVVKEHVSHLRGFWALIGDVIDLYLPKVVGTLLGGNDIAAEHKESNPSSENKP